MLPQVRCYRADPSQAAQPLGLTTADSLLVRLAAEASGRPQAPTPHGRPAYTPSPTSVASTSDTDATSLLYSNVPTIVQPVVERVGLKTDDGEDSECAAACRELQLSASAGSRRCCAQCPQKARRGGDVRVPGRGEPPDGHYHQLAVPEQGHLSARSHLQRVGCASLLQCRLSGTALPHRECCRRRWTRYATCR